MKKNNNQAIFRYVFVIFILLLINIKTEAQDPVNCQDVLTASITFSVPDGYVTNVCEEEGLLKIQCSITSEDASIQKVKIEFYHYELYEIIDFGNTDFIEYTYFPSPPNSQPIWGYMADVDLIQIGDLELYQGEFEFTIKWLADQFYDNDYGDMMLYVFSETPVGETPAFILNDHPLDCFGGNSSQYNDDYCACATINVGPITMGQNGIEIYYFDVYEDLTWPASWMDFPVYTPNYCDPGPGIAASFYLEGDFLIDDDLCAIGETTWPCEDGCYPTEKRPWKIVKDAQIIVKNRFTLDLTNVGLYPCEGFWGGIYVEAGATLICDDVIFENAFTAITVEKEGTVILNNCTFKNCVYGIEFLNVGPEITASSSITNCQFIGDQDFYYPAASGGELGFPEPLYRPMAGVSAFNHSDIDISGNNEFQHLTYGIRSFESGVTADNNTMDDIEKEAILVSNSGSNRLNSFEGNTITNAKTGIHAVKSKLDAINNTISDVDYGIRNIRSGINHFTINDNTITARIKGVFSFMAGNHILWGIDFFFIQNNRIDITEENILTSALEMHFTDNTKVDNNIITINNNRAGILMNQSDKNEVNHNSIFIDESVVNSHGIHLTASRSNFIDYNWIKDMTGVTTDNKGIFVETSPNNTYTCNEFAGILGHSMQFFDDCNESYLIGNYHGFNEIGLVVGVPDATFTTVIGKQGNFINGNGNKWPHGASSEWGAYNSSPQDFADDSQFIVDTLDNPYYMPNPWFSNSDKWFVLKNQAFAIECDGSAGTSLLTTLTCEEIMKLWEKIDESDNFSDVRKWFWKYRIIKRWREQYRDTILLDSCYLKYDSLRNSDFTKVAEVEEAFDTLISTDIISPNMIQAFRTKLNLIPDYPGYLLNLKTVYEVAVNFIETDDEFTSQDLLILESLGLACAMDDGDAVYIARSLYSLAGELDYSDLRDCSFDPVLPRSMIPSKADISYRTIKHYPNPVSEVLTVEIPVCEHILMLKLSDLFGRQVLTRNILPGEQKIKIPTSGMHNGVYFIEIWDKGQQLYKEKVLITK